MPKLESRPLPCLKLDPKQPRKLPENDADLTASQRAGLIALGESLKVKQLQPVLCQPDGTLIAGERRYRAAKLVGLATLEAKIADVPLSEPEVRRWQLVENMQRSDLKALEQVDGLEELARVNPGMNNKELADLLNIDPSMVTRLRSVARCIPAVHEALRAETIGISDAYALSKCSTPEEQTTLLALKLSGASRDTIEQTGRKNRTGTVAAVRVAKVKCLLPSGYTVVVSGEGVSLEAAAEALADAIKEMKRARDLGYTAKTFSAAMADRAKKG